MYLKEVGYVKATFFFDREVWSDYFGTSISGMTKSTTASTCCSGA
jgi:hypothetical protein